MGISKFELSLAGYLEYKGHITFKHFENKYKKSVSSLKRHIYNLNSYLPADKKFILDDEKVINKLSYRDWLAFIDSLDLSRYTPSKLERIHIILIYSFLNDYVNMSQLYSYLFLSPTTKKSDSKELDIFLEKYSLTKEIISSKGIRIMGDEAKFRVLITSILSQCMEISLDDRLEERKANNPLEKLIFEYFYCKTEEHLQTAASLIHIFFREKPCKLSYPSKKFLFIYIVLVLYRNKEGIYVNKIKNPNVETEEIRLFENEDENKFLSYLVGSFDFNTPMSQKIYDKRLVKITEDFLEIVFEIMTTKIFTYDSLYQEVYAYLKKTILTSALREDFYDIKLDETYIHIKRMYGILSSSIDFIEREYPIVFNESRIAALTLIFRKYVIKNKLVGRNTKKIVIVTNSAIEKSYFFFEMLRQYVDIELAAIVNINELDLLKDQQYHTVMIFSNRIKMLLHELDIPCIKMNFYITNEEVQFLLDNGFSTASRKLYLDDFIHDIVNKSENEIRNYIIDQYPDYFIF